MSKFLKGYLSAICLYSLYQDIIFGTAEKCAEHILNNWTDRSITIPIAIIFLLVIFFAEDKN